MKFKIIITFLLLICMTTYVEAIPFNSTWNTASVSSGSSNSTTIALPIESGGTYAFTVNWGDGNSSQVTAYGQSTANHTYASEGVYNLSINGTINGFRFANIGDRLKITDISQWGDLNLGNSNKYFYGCSNLNASATDTLNLTGTTDMSYMFFYASAFNGNVSSWDTSNVTNMKYMFSYANAFNQNLDGWDTSSVTNMYALFYHASTFNNNINTWNTSSVMDMSFMFHSAFTFNQDLDSWNTSSVTDMNNMFYDISVFNGNISTWDISSVTDIKWMFSFTDVFNQDLDSWNTSSVTDMSYIFYYASAFNGNISTWDTSSVTNMRDMFNYANVFNQNLSTWNVSSVTDMNNMFIDTALTRQNYDALLIGWSNLTLQNGVTFYADDIKYSMGEPTTARAILINTYNWTITDGGQLYINVYIFNSSTGSYDNVSTRTVQPNQGLLIYSNADVTWERTL